MVVEAAVSFHLASSSRLGDHLAHVIAQAARRAGFNAIDPIRQLPTALIWRRTSMRYWSSSIISAMPQT